MTSSAAKPEPRSARRYRYSKWRWRLGVRALDLAGGLAMRLWRLARPAKPVEAPRRILLVQLDHLGDAVLTSPAFPRLRAAYPDAVLDVLASSSNRAVFEADPQVDRVIVAPATWLDHRSPGWGALRLVWALGRALRAGRYDLGIDVRGDVLTVLVLALAGIPRRLGWAMGGGAFLLTDVAAWVPERHEVRSRLALLDRLGIPPDGPARVMLPVGDAARARVARLLHEPAPRRAQPKKRPAPVATSGGAGEARGARKGERGPLPSGPGSEGERLHAGRFGSEAPLLAVHLGAGTAAKRWPPGHWRALIDRFLADGWRVVIVGGPEDVAASEGVPPRPALLDLTSRLSVTETTALLERAELFIGADSGPAHLAACAGVPSVVIFSGTNRARQWRPWSRRSLVLKQPVPCRPCHHKTCPLADHPCMSGLRPERVYRVARRWWARLHRSEAPHAPL